ncbi:Poly [ADP-ribose] polymerase 3 [Rhizophlyctis rosea]|uniref:Poly [ADP-ribose] polymerase n=1 Tax=Rhizophlyctis rosea TaxID=64517 RepID=A0AAD5S7D3_9FUNG|nr:Poly [ADP-ribose] polymerase 3 [Rhizophlyctis rosea]
MATKDHPHRDSTFVDTTPSPYQSYTITSEQLDQILNRLAPPKPILPRTGLGNPGPLGLGAFALTTFTLSCFNAGVFIEKELEGVVLPLALFYGGLAQFAAGMWEYKVENTFGATAFSSYGAFWMSFAAYVYLIVPTLTPAIANHATGLFLFAWTIFTLYMWVASFRVSVSVFAVFTGLFPTFLLLTIGALANSPVTTRVGGWFGLATAAAAWYGSAAVVINSTFGRGVMPVGAYSRVAAGVADRIDVGRRVLKGLKAALVERLTQALNGGDVEMEDADAPEPEPVPESAPDVRRSGRTRKAAVEEAPPVIKAPAPKRAKKTPQPPKDDNEEAVAADSKTATKRGKKRKAEEPKEEDDEDAEEAPSHIAKKMATETTKPKGTPKIDPLCSLPGTTAEAANVHVEGDGIYDVMLNQVNIGNNNNKFYVIQLITHPYAFVVFTRWGRVGENGQQAQTTFGSIDEAKNEFAKKFKAKSGNTWSSDIRESFEPKSGKYTLLEMSYEDDDGTPEAAAKEAENTLPCSLDKPTASLLSLIFDDNTFKQQMKDFNIDTERMPLGKLSRSTIENGRRVLVEIQRVVSGETKGDLKDLSSQFYTWIPHAYGRGTPPPVLKDADTIQKKIDLCNVLADIEIAQSLKKTDAKITADKPKSTPTKRHPLDTNYISLKAKLSHIAPTSAVHKIINTYLEQTRCSNVTLIDAWEVDREGEADRFAAHDDINERKLLWHGTNVAVVAAILATGLRIMPHAGGRVGRGLYFASENAKSASYTSAGPDGTACMFLAEVALGKQHEINNDDPSLRAAPKGFDSVVAKGHTEPDPKKNTTIKLDGNDVVVPQGKAVDQKAWKDSSFWHSEYLVYKESQVRLRYVLRVKLY